MPGITVSAGYGAGGSVVAPRIAERLGWRFVDRAITSTVAERLRLPAEQVESGGTSRWNRFLGSLAALSPTIGQDSTGAWEEAEIRTGMAAELRAAVHGGGAVVLGRAGACVFLDDPDVLRVRLVGPKEARVRQAAALEQIDEETARRRLEEVDRARNHYVRRLYGRLADDPELYHVHLDSTALDLDACVELVVSAWQAFLDTGRRRALDHPGGAADTSSDVRG